jgi:phosphoglycolate phosphatase-like HAD superfamily hydrolase
MKITLYAYPDSESLESEPKAFVFWNDGEITIQTEDQELKQQLEKFYAKPLSVRRSVSLSSGVVGFKEVEILPYTEEFFMESVYLVRTLNYYGKLEGERKAQVVALDFDGTLWDSVHECFVITCKAYEKLGISIPSRPDLEEKFKRGRFFVRIGDEFYLLLNWIIQHPDRDPETMSEEEQESLRKENGLRILFEKTFYEIRQQMRETNFKEWCALQNPYPGILDQIKEIQKKFFKVVIATTKDAASVRKLLGIHGLDLDVVGKENTVDKARQMNFISAAYKVPLSQIIFVDDILEQVKVVRTIGAKGVLAGWGYGSPRQKKEAEHLRIPVLALETFAKTMEELF